MAYEQKPNSLSLFKNDRKDTEQHPDYKGSGLVGDVEYWVSGWINEIRTGEKAGQKYMSLKLDAKEQQPVKDIPFGSEPPPPNGNEQIDDDDVPF